MGIYKGLSSLYTLSATSSVPTLWQCQCIHTTQNRKKNRDRAAVVSIKQNKGVRNRIYYTDWLGKISIGIDRVLTVLRHMHSHGRWKGDTMIICRLCLCCGSPEEEWKWSFHSKITEWKVFVHMVSYCLYENHKCCITIRMLARTRTENTCWYVWTSIFLFLHTKKRGPCCPCYNPYVAKYKYAQHQALPSTISAESYAHSK